MESEIGNGMIWLGAPDGFLGFYKCSLKLVHVLEFTFLSCHFLMPLGNIFPLVMAMRPMLISCAVVVGTPVAYYMVAYLLIAWKRVARVFLWL